VARRALGYRSLEIPGNRSPRQMVTSRKGTEPGLQSALDPPTLERGRFRIRIPQRRCRLIHGGSEGEWMYICSL